MPAEFQILPALHLKHARIWGRVDYPQIESCFFRTIRHPDFRPDLRILADLRGLTDPVGGLWEFWKLKQLYAGFYGPQNATADVVILTEGKVSHRAGRIFGWLMRDKHPLRVRVTRHLDEALRILSLPPGSLAPDLPQDTTSNVIPLARFRSM